MTHPSIKVPKIYIIDSSTISIKEQNIILKFVEEPLKNSYIIILKNSKLLPTILNRCQKWKFEAYSKEELLLVLLTEAEELELEEYLSQLGNEDEY